MPGCLRNYGDQMRQPEIIFEYRQSIGGLPSCRQSLLLLVKKVVRHLNAGIAVNTGIVAIAATCVGINSVQVCAQPQPKDPLLSGFQNPPPEVRMRMFWRIFGPSWEKAEIDYQLKIMKEAGIGGVMLFPMYPVALDEP